MQVKIDCICQPRAGGEPRHPQGDTVDLRDTLGFRDAATIRNAILAAMEEDPDAKPPEVLAILTEYYLLSGIESWSLLDDKSKPIPVTRPNIREHLLTHHVVALKVGDAADGIYTSAVMLPLLATASTSSPPTPTDDSTSPKTGSTDEVPRPSKRSSTTTTPTDATELMSPSLVGVSN